MKVDSVLPQIQGLSKGASKPSASEAFGDMLEKAITSTADDQKRAEALSTAAANGDNVNMHEVIEAVSKAELTLQTMLTVRDKAVEAYREIANMPI